jgi:regulator of sirC expression with transglutaminase-like and TPR domain
MTDRVGQVRSTENASPLERRGRDAARETRALISLLSDDDSRIVAMVWENLLRLGAAALPYLAEAAEDPDPRLRIRARHIRQRIHLEQVERQFRRLASRRGGTFDLETALSLVARIEHPDLDRRAIATQLDELAEGVRPLLPAEAPPLEKVRILSRYLFDEVGFRGNRENYYDPDNSFINKVLERRRGIPISLAAVTILVGRRVGLPLYAVGLPKHFLVKYQDASSEIFFDPFHGGRILSPSECTQILASEGYYVRERFIAEYLAIASPRELIIRMLRNLILIYSKARDKRKVRRLIRYVEALRSRPRARR